MNMTLVGKSEVLFDSRSPHMSLWIQLKLIISKEKVCMYGFFKIVIPQHNDRYGFQMSHFKIKIYVELNVTLRIGLKKCMSNICVST